MSPAAPHSRLTRQQAELVAERGQGLIARAHARLCLQKAERGELQFAEEEEQ